MGNSTPCEIVTYKNTPTWNFAHAGDYVGQTARLHTTQILVVVVIL